MGLRPSQIERMSHAFAMRVNDPRCEITHSTLAGIEAGALPSLYKILSLAYCLRLTEDQMMDWYGIDLPTVRPVLQQRAATQPAQQQHIAHPAQRNVHFPFPWPSGPAPAKTGLFAADAPGQRPDLERFRYARIGARDDSMMDLLPPGSLVRVDTQQRKILVFPWATMWHRPIYLVWHTFGHSCRWCQQNRSELILLSHPGSHKLAAVFRSPKEATVIGRVVSVWTAQEETPMEFPGVSLSGIAQQSLERS